MTEERLAQIRWFIAYWVAHRGPRTDMPLDFAQELLEEVDRLRNHGVDREI